MCGFSAPRAPDLFGQLAHLLARHDDALQRHTRPSAQLLAPSAFPGGQGPVRIRKRLLISLSDTRSGGSIGFHERL